MEHEENPHPSDDLMGAIRTIVRQELARALHPAVEDKLLTVSEAAEYLRLAKPTIYSLVQQNKIPCMKKTKRLYFSEIKLKEWLDQYRSLFQTTGTGHQLDGESAGSLRAAMVCPYADNEKDAARQEVWNQYQKFVDYVANQMVGWHRFVDDLVQDVVGDEEELKKAVSNEEN